MDHGTSTTLDIPKDTQVRLNDTILLVKDILDESA